MYLFEQVFYIHKRKLGVLDETENEILVDVFQ